MTSRRTTRLRVLAAAVPFVVSAGAIACQQLLSIDGDVTVTGPVDTCGLSVNGGACQACVASQCCTQAASCAHDQACTKYETCLLGCGSDYACRSDCVANDPIGSGSSVPAFDQCVASSCADACGISCGVAGSYTRPADAAPGCQDCIAAHACSQAEACTTSLACERTAYCAYSCVTPDCQNACLQTDDAGTFLALAYSMGTSCLSACRVGNNWSCVGRVTWPFASTPSIDVTLTVQDSGSHAPLEGIVVKACPAGDRACSNSPPTGKTDPQGQVTLSIPQAAFPLGFEGYFDLTSPTQDIVHYLFFLSYPMTAPHSSLAVLPMSPASLSSLVSVLPGVSLDATRGVASIAAGDCLLVGSTGVSFAATGTDDKTTQAYVQGGILSTTATATDLSGIGFFLNAPSGTVSIEATPLATGRVSSRVTVFVEPGAVSFVQAIPTPN